MYEYVLMQKIKSFWLVWLCFWLGSLLLEDEKTPTTHRYINHGSKVVSSATEIHLINTTFCLTRPIFADNPIRRYLSNKHLTGERVNEHWFVFYSSRVCRDRSLFRGSCDQTFCRLIPNTAVSILNFNWAGFIFAVNFSPPFIYYFASLPLLLYYSIHSLG